MRVVLGKSDNDQKPFQYILKVVAGVRRQQNGWVQMNRIDMDYERGTLVKHFIRTNSHSWTDINIDTRTYNIQQVAEEVCQRYTRICD
jgi:hypothetical protein